MADSDSSLTAAAAPELARRTLPSPTPLRPLLARLKPYPAPLIFGALALLLSSAIGLAFPLIVRELLDAAFVKGDGGLLNKLALLLVVIFAVQGVLSFVQVWLITSVAEKVIARLRSELFAHLVRLSPGFFAEQRTGELTSRLSTDLTLLQSV
ncbi:MAG: transporter transrane region, partial [Gemmatimonadetes bacterium]|nr:transporter transrane region [Gemmatimonadota bacterium]